MELLKRPNLRAYVVVRDAVARRYEELGVDKPWHVIPYGVNLRSLSPEVMGFHASWLRSRGDRHGEDPFITSITCWMSGRISVAGSPEPACG